MAHYQVRAPPDRRNCKAVPGVTTFLNCKVHVGEYGDTARNRLLNRVGERREAYRFASIGQGRRTRGGSSFNMIRNIAGRENKDGQVERKTLAKRAKNHQKTRRKGTNKKKGDIAHHRWRTECAIKTGKNTMKKQSRHGQPTILLRSIPEGKYRHKKILQKLQHGIY